MKDYIVRATAANGQVRAFAATTRGVVETARKDHNTSPIATVALGRLLTGAAMMGIMMKNDSDILTVQIKGNGPIGAMTVTAEPNGHVKGFVANPEVMLPLKNGHMDIAGAVGIGVLSVIKDIGLREPYVGDTILITSEIADDLTYYFATSEQVPSSAVLLYCILFRLAMIESFPDCSDCGTYFSIHLRTSVPEQSPGKTVFHQLVQIKGSCYKTFFLSSHGYLDLSTAVGDKR